MTLTIALVDGRLRLSDDAGWSIDLTIVGPTAKLIESILVGRQMGFTKLGQTGAPIAHTIFDEIAKYERQRRTSLSETLPSVDMELDL